MDKWYAIAMVAFVTAMFGGMAFDSYQKNQCRVAAVQAGKSAEDIEKICR
jgi:hypothetical protein